MVQVPTSTRVRVLPDTVQIDVVCELKLTASPEDAVALIANDGDPYAWLGNDANEIVWFPCVTWKLWLTGVAASQSVLPDWVA